MSVKRSEQANSPEFFFSFFFFFLIFKKIRYFGVLDEIMILETTDKTRFSLTVKRLHLKKTHLFPLKKPLAFGKPRYSCSFHF